MKLSTRSRYAVRAMANLARKPADRPASLAIIAGEEGISLNFLEQIFMSLRRKGLVRATRGPAGGYFLARPAGEISLADIIEAVGESILPAPCAGGKEGGPHCSRELVCLTRHAWEEFGETMTWFLKSFTLAHVVDRGLPREPAPPRS